MISVAVCGSGGDNVAIKVKVTLTTGCEILVVSGGIKSLVEYIPG